MKSNYKIFLFICFLFLFLFSLLKIKQPFNSNNMLNIYDLPLQSCGDNTMTNGSWDNNKKCSELGGGVHQICIKNIAKNTQNFSLDTGQSDWSNKRQHNNHCACLGAWALYNSKLKQNQMNYPKNVLKCDAIPKVSLSEQYVKKFSQGWNKWNGLEINNQIKDGIESLIENCYNPNDHKSQNLKRNYCNFAKNINSLNNTNLYRNLC